MAKTIELKPESDQHRAPATEQRRQQAWRCKREPSMAPKAKPSAITPAAKPNCRDANHSRFSLTKFSGSTGCNVPYKNENSSSDQKSTAKPRSALQIPAARHINTSDRRVPKASISEPPMKAVKMPITMPTPQITPI